MINAYRYEHGCRGQDDDGKQNGFGGCRPDKAQRDFDMRDGCGKNLVDGAGELREVNPEGCIRYALCEQHQHDETRYDEAAVIDAVDLIDTVADRRTEHDEIQ